MATKKVSELKKGDRVTLSGRLQPGAFVERDGQTPGPDDDATVTGTVDHTDMRSIQADVVSLVDDSETRWPLIVAREIVVEVQE